MGVFQSKARRLITIRMMGILYKSGSNSSSSSSDTAGEDDDDDDDDVPVMDLFAGSVDPNMRLREQSRMIMTIQLEALMTPFEAWCKS